MTHDDLTGDIARRVQAAIFDAGISRAVVDFDWPECHKRGCNLDHGNVDAALANMKHVIAESVRSELGWRTVTRPDLGGVDEFESPRDLAEFTLAVALSRFAKNASTYVDAARLIVEAYPGMVAALTADHSVEAEKVAA